MWTVTGKAIRMELLKFCETHLLPPCDLDAGYRDVGINVFPDEFWFYIGSTVFFFIPLFLLLE